MRPASGDGRDALSLALGAAAPGSEVTLPLATAVPPPERRPASDPGAWCQVWKVGQGAAAPITALDAEVEESLRALGYL